MKNSHIEWTDHTFNPWIGCTKVSPGCANCYAEARDQRFAKGIHWGKGAPRQRTSAANWKQPLKWDRDAKAAREVAVDAIITVGGGAAMPPHRPRVFCASLADWLDDEVQIEWSADLIKLIHATPNLDWLLLTKRPQNWSDRVEGVLKWIEARPDWCTENNPWEPVRNFLADWFVLRKAPANVWLGTTVENQPRADERIPKLLEIPARVRFLSCEPLLGPLDLYNGDPDPRLGGHQAAKTFLGDWWEPGDVKGSPSRHGVDWIICGGESGPGARPMHPDWARSLRDQCQAADVAFHFKQWGEWSPHKVSAGGDLGGDLRRGKVIHFRANGENDGHYRKGDCYMIRSGKVNAGRLLDGREWNEFPKVEDSI